MRAQKTTRQSTRAGTRRPAEKDAIALLKEDHEKVRELLGELEETTSKATSRRQTLLKSIEQELKIHTKIEEEIFYPAFRDASLKEDDKKLYYEALEEHHVVDMVPSRDQEDRCRLRRVRGQGQGLEGPRGAPRRGGGDGDVPAGAQAHGPRGAAPAWPADRPAKESMTGGHPDEADRDGPQLDPGMGTASRPRAVARRGAPPGPLTFLGPPPTVWAPLEQHDSTHVPGGGAP